MDLKRKNYESMPAPTKKPHFNEELIQKPQNIAEDNEIEENVVDSEEDDQEIDKDEILREILEVLFINVKVNNI